VKRIDTLMRAKRFRVDDLQRRIATLDGMRSDADRKLADLDESVAREKQRAHDSEIGRLAFPSFLRSIENRRQNLCSTVKELERERALVEVELTVAQQELKSLEFTTEQQQRRAEEVETRRAQARLQELDIVRHLRKHALRSA
jgi:chromosome segregation ATPase